MWIPDRVALLASWSPASQQTKSLNRLVRGLSSNGYEVLVVSACEVPGILTWPEGLPDGVTVLRRPNVGYDFGSWAAGLHAFPGIASANRCLLLNDSMVGPFRPLDQLLQRFEAAEADVWGLVDTAQDAYHFQSHFVGYRDGALRDPTLRRFWGGIRLQPTKRQLISRYEIGYMRVLRRAGMRLGVGFPWQDVVVQGGNPTSAGWRRLLLRGFPWIKREIVLRPPPEVPDGDDVAAVVRQLFDEDVTTWV
jgi:hypothetical protein